MLANFFQLPSLPLDQFTGNYDIRLVVLSYIVAVFASYVALDFTARLRDRNNTRISSLLWLIGGAFAMGAGIWSMHFIGMLSFSIPGLTLQYDIFWTIISLIVAIAAAWFVLYLLKKSVVNIVHLIAGGVILGLGIASMHYTGMAAMLITLDIRYLPGLFLLSIFIAILASEAAILLALKSAGVILRLRSRVKILSALVMGLGICGMHYTGMAASVFTPLCNPVATNLTALDPNFLSIVVAAVTFLILGVALIALNYKEALNQQEFEKARQLGMEEISSSVLHNVGNVLNSVNISVETLAEKNDASQLVGLKKLCTLLNEHKDHLGDFITNDARGIKTLEFLNKLADYWYEEQQWMRTEIDALNKNVNLIKDIISTQQSLSKTIGMEQIVLIDDLLNEALLISGLNLKNQKIIVEKKYAKLHPITTDKVKLIQLLVNFFRNARDALIESSNQDKRLIIKTAPVDKDTILIEITDTGIGILPANIHKIFHYGFTTKESGHGFGLHTSALAISNLGGKVQVHSQGLEKGTTFSITLPYKLPK